MPHLPEGFAQRQSAVGLAGAALCPDLTGVVLAGGFGTRLRSVVADRPKVLALAAGRPFLLHLLDALVDAGVQRLVLCVGYLADHVIACVGDVYRDVPVVYSRESTPCGTGGALRLALDAIATERVVVVNGDSYCAVDLSAALAFHQAHRASITLSLTQVSDASRYGCVSIDVSGRITAFREKGSDVGPGWINAGVYLMERRLIASLPASGFLSLEREVLGCWQGDGLYGFAQGGAFLDIGIPEDYARVDAFLESLSTPVA